jgi:hypothetical protein
VSAVEASPLRDRYVASLRNRIQKAWIKPPSARVGVDCLVEVTQVPGGEVTAARVTQCNGDAAVRQSIENAVYRASPLPDPPIRRCSNEISPLGSSPMNKKLFLAALCVVLFVPPSWGEFVVEVTRGQDDAIPIAIVPFTPAEAAADSFDVARLVSDDLARSGRFKSMDRKDMIEEPHTGAKISFDDWRRLGNDYILVGQVQPQGPDRYNISFELYNVLNRQRLLGYQISANRAGMRLASHQVADMVFEKILGIRGAFATRIAYISVQGSVPNRSYRLIVADADGENPHTVMQSNEPLMSPAWSPDGQNLAYVSFEARCPRCTCSI